MLKLINKPIKQTEREIIVILAINKAFLNLLFSLFSMFTNKLGSLIEFIDVIMLLLIIF